MAQMSVDGQRKAVENEIQRLSFSCPRGIIASEKEEKKERPEHRNISFFFFASSKSIAMSFAAMRVGTTQVLGDVEIVYPTAAEKKDAVVDRIGDGHYWQFEEPRPLQFAVQFPPLASLA